VTADASAQKRTDAEIRSHQVVLDRSQELVDLVIQADKGATDLGVERDGMAVGGSKRLGHKTRQGFPGGSSVRERSGLEAVQETSPVRKGNSDIARLGDSWHCHYGAQEVVRVEIGAKSSVEHWLG